MKRFIKNILLFAIPFYPLLIAAILVFSFDIFQLYGFYDNYYNSKMSTPNREMVCTKTYNKYRASEQYNSFIFGSSRTHSFKCSHWRNYLPPTAKPFHFDASGESVWGILKKMEYIIESGDRIQEALIVMDEYTFKNSKNRRGSHILISMPCISKESYWSYYSIHIKTALNPSFLQQLYQTYQKRKARGEATFSKKTSANKYCDMPAYWQEEHLKQEKDSIAYYNEQIQNGIFYDRRSTPKTSNYKMKDITIKQLEQLKQILVQQRTNYKIVISPLYDQIPLRKQHLEVLDRIFGKENVYNFSGKNEFTTPLGNYYEESHYRPHVANKIMQLIYQ